VCCGEVFGASFLANINYRCVVGVKSVSCRWQRAADTGKSWVTALSPVKRSCRVPEVRIGARLLRFSFAPLSYANRLGMGKAFLPQMGHQTAAPKHAALLARYAVSGRSHVGCLGQFTTLGALWIT
jgi:hypothetical protein